LHIKNKLTSLSIDFIGLTRFYDVPSKQAVEGSNPSAFTPKPTDISGFFYARLFFVCIFVPHFSTF